MQVFISQFLSHIVMWSVYVLVDRDRDFEWQNDQCSSLTIVLGIQADTIEMILFAYLLSTYVGGSLLLFYISRIVVT